MSTYVHINTLKRYYIRQTIAKKVQDVSYLWRSQTFRHSVQKTKQKNYYLTLFYKLHLLYSVMPQLISRAIRFKKDDFSNLSREEFPLLLQLSPPLQREIAQNMNKSRVNNL